MSDDFNFQLALIDKMSGPARGAAASMNQLNQILIQIQQTNVTLHSSVQTGKQGFESWATSLSSAMNVATKFKDVIVGVTETVAGLAAGFASAVLEQAQFHQRSMTTLDALLQDEAGGSRREFSGAVRMAQGLPGGVSDVAGSRVALASTFLDRDQRDRMFALQQDLSALSFNQDAGTNTRSTTVLTDIANAGVLRSEELRQLVNLKAGIGKGDVFRQIAQARGLHGDERSVFQQVQALVSENQISSQEGLAALQNAMVGKTHMALGGLAHKQGAGLIGQISNLKELGTNTLLTLFSRQENTTSSPGMSAFLKFLTKTNQFFEQGSVTGERFLKVVDDLVNGVFSQLFGNDPTPVLGHMLELFELLVPVVTSVLGAFKTFGGGIADALLPMLKPAIEMLGALNDPELSGGLQLLGQILGFVAGAIAAVGAAIVLGAVVIAQGFVVVGQAIAEALGWLVTTGVDLGGRFVQGLANGISGAAHWVWDSIKNLADGAVQMFKDLWGIHSPSTVMFEMGGHLSTGLALGVDSEASQVSEALANSFTVPNGGALSRSGGSRADALAGANVQLTVNFNLPNSTDAHELADAARPMFESALAEMVERMSISAGVG